MPQRVIEFFFDYGSPYSYIANARLPALARHHGAEIAYRPMLLGGVFKATGNQSPIYEPVAPKRAYGVLTRRRSAALHGVAFEHNPHFPINTLALMRAAVAAQHESVFGAFHAAVYPAMWTKGLDLGNSEVLADVLTAAGLDAEQIQGRAQGAAVKDELRATTEEAVARGVFGAPSLFFDGELYFGVDHLPLLEHALGKPA